MLKKLQNRVILLTMLLVGVVIISVIAAICINTYSRANHMISSALTSAYKYYISEEKAEPNISGGSDEDGSGSSGSDLRRVSTFITVYDMNGDLKETVSTFGTMKKSSYEKATQIVDKSDKSKGIIKSMNIAFYKAKHNNDTVYVFADTYTQLTYAKQQIIQSIWFGALALMVLCVISICLSRVVVRPVEKAWEQQHQFVADASHELKTPLTVILANNDILMSKDHLDKTVREERQWIDSTEAEAVHMKKLVDNLLFLARSDAQADKAKNIVFSEVVFSDIVTDTYLQFDPVAFEKGVELNAEIDPGITVSGDSTQLKQLSHILIDNAIKYAGLAGVVSVKMTSDGQNALFSVNNTGAPIAKEDIKHIFERFYRADKARTQGGGYGLGLAIAKNIVETHHGVIKCESDEEHGTTFTASLPLAKAKSGVLRIRRSPKKQKTGSSVNTVTSKEYSSLSLSKPKEQKGNAKKH
ncbi:MAG: HAMP domain-containing sensor histidine kinase [Anaerovoracaceae bacterium]|nr:HAMP domain-containing sensor histidine kinase [Anaerovoracaceae bacterium]